MYSEGAGITVEFLRNIHVVKAGGKADKNNEVYFFIFINKCSCAWR